MMTEGNLRRRGYEERKEAGGERKGGRERFTRYLASDVGHVYYGYEAFKA